MKLGEKLEVVGFALKGSTTKGDVIDLADAITKALKMHKAHEPMMYWYPINNLGGLGFTFIQPITESFIAFDAWNDFGGGYLIICSCKNVNLNKINRLVQKMGYKVKKMCANELRLSNGLFQ